MKNRFMWVFSLALPIFRVLGVRAVAMKSHRSGPQNIQVLRCELYTTKFMPLQEDIIYAKSVCLLQELGGKKEEDKVRLKGVIALAAYLRELACRDGGQKVRYLLGLAH